MQESYVKITYLEGEGLLIAEWKGFLTLEQVRRGCARMSRAISENNISRHLSNHTDLRLLGKEVQEYLTGSWFYEVEALGLRKLAVKVAEDIFAKATVHKVNTQHTYGELVIDTFGSCKAARAWLKV